MFEVWTLRDNTKPKNLFTALETKKKISYPKSSVEVPWEKFFPPAQPSGSPAEETWRWFWDLKHSWKDPVFAGVAGVDVDFPSGF